jgi:Alpha-2,8-polysialyltransferase (POLYST)
LSAAAPGGRHLFLVQSSLQFILAAAAAEEMRQTQQATCRMLFLPDVLDPALFAQVVEGWTDTPFDRVAFIAPRRLPSQTGPARPWRAIRHDIVQALQDFAPTGVTVFNDRQDAGQTLLIETAKRFPKARRECTEDGAHSYTTFTYRRHGTLTRLRQHWRLGRGWADVRVLGTHPLVQQFNATHPELLRRELRGDEVRPFPLHRLGAETIRHLATCFCERVGFDRQRISACAAIVTLNHSGYARRNPDYAALVQACVTQLRASATPFFFKYHPRETTADPLGLATQGAVGEIARTLPVECLYLLMREQPLLVIGGMSTSLLTAGLLMPHARTAALVHASNAGDAWDASLLGALKITPLADEQAVARYLATQRAEVRNSTSPL